MTRFLASRMFGRFPSLAGAPEIERRAQRIADPLERLRYLRQATASPAASGIRRRPWRWVAPFLLIAVNVPMASDALLRAPSGSPLPPPAIHQAGGRIPNVWAVEGTRDAEVYSNGLRIETRLAVSNEPRSYTLIHRDSGEPGPVRSQPAGIVFHTTESDQAPFEAAQNHALKRIGQELLLYVRDKRAYHFLIDRFGRVHRIVVESDTANHAGHSVWADSRWLYLNLNASFLGVAFEAQTQAGEPPISQAQIHAAAVLTEMLRSKYNLAAENCVAHAQVSVNPGNMRIGWHTDWGSGFPFPQIGLPDNYARPNPSLYLFGFEYDPNYIHSTGPELWRGLALAEEQVREAAAVRGLAVAEYTKVLQQRYREQIVALQQRSAPEED